MNDVLMATVFSDLCVKLYRSQDDTCNNHNNTYLVNMLWFRHKHWDRRKGRNFVYRRLLWHTSVAKTFSPANKSYLLSLSSLKCHFIQHLKQTLTIKYHQVSLKRVIFKSCIYLKTLSMRGCPSRIKLMCMFVAHHVLLYQINWFLQADIKRDEQGKYFVTYFQTS